MKYNKIIPVVALAALYLTSCDDQKMDWYTDPEHGEVTTAEIPLKLTEQIANYKTIKEYAAQYAPNMSIGLGLGAELYISDAAYKKVSDENFQIYTTGNAMKHASVVDATGKLVFKAIDDFFAAIPVDMPVYGHNFIWHSQQRASYLNGLLAPTVIPAPGGSNLVENGAFEGNITGWSSWGSGKQTVEYTTGEKLGGAGSLKAVTTAGAANLWDLEIQCSNIPIVAGHHYEVSFFIKSEGTGKVRIAFNNMSNSYPYVNGKETAETTSTWKQVTYNSTTIGGNFIPAVGATTMNFRFDLGAVPNMTYYIDNVVVVDLDAVVEPLNLLSNGKFNADLTGWSRINGPADCMSHVSGTEAYQGGAMKVVNPTDNTGGEWKVQLQAGFSEKLTAGKDYVVSYYIRSEAPGSVRCSTTGNAKYQGNTATTTTWTEIKWEVAGTGAEAGLSFDLGLKAGTYYIDNVLVTPKVSTPAPSTGPTIIEKTPAEKKARITTAMKEWIEGMMVHCKSRVTMWDVLNEPITDGSKLRGVEDIPAEQGDQEFYWGQYMGKEYAVKAFQFARQYGNPTDKLFINDYNLEVSPSKLAKLIEYVNYIDQTNGSPIVDGIGTQMHLIASTITRKQIDDMFKTMAATGKLIRITELDVRLGTLSPTAEQLKLQSDVYRMAVDSYKANVPAAQQSGITIWTLTDDAREHTYWFPDDSPNLFDKNYGRKYAYKGFCDGLAGKDIGAEFSGDDWKNAY